MSNNNMIQQLSSSEQDTSYNALAVTVQTLKKEMPDIATAEDTMHYLGIGSI